MLLKRIVETESSTRCGSSKRLFELVREDLNDTNVRLVSNSTFHEKLIAQRRTYLDELICTLNQCLDVNKQLASRYRTLKFEIWDERFSLMKKFEIKINRLLGVKDKRQMNALQVRMNQMLDDFFQFKSTRLFG